MYSDLGVPSLPSCLVKPGSTGGSDGTGAKLAGTGSGSLNTRCYH